MSDIPTPGPEPGPRSRDPARPVVAVIVWSLLFGLLWLVLGGPDPMSWIIGIPAVMGAVWAKACLSGSRLGGLSYRGAAQFLPYFLLESLKGGSDVALRVSGPRVRVDPGYVTYPLRLVRPSARIFFMNVVNLLPGTLTADIAGNEAKIHTLDQGKDPVWALIELEERVAALFGERLPPPVARP